MTRMTVAPQKAAIRDPQCIKSTAEIAPNPPTTPVRNVFAPTAIVRKVSGTTSMRRTLIKRLNPAPANPPVTLARIMAANDG